MPITYGDFTRQLKLLPLTLTAEGGATVTVRFGFVGIDGVFSPATSQEFGFTPEEVSTILDAPSISGLSRRDDLSFAIYSLLVQQGKVEAGTIS